jgi:hypothetical protein
MIKSEIKKEIENYKTLKWYQTSKGKSLIIISVIFLITFWYRSIVALPMLPIIYFVRKGSKTAIILAGLYSVFLTLVNIGVYIVINVYEKGGYDPNWRPVYVFIGILIFAFIYLKDAYDVEKSKDKFKIEEKITPKI